MSVNPSQSWITPTTALFGTGGGSALPQDITCSSITVADYGLAYSLQASTITGSVSITSQGPLNFSIFGGTAGTWTGIQDNKATRQATLLGGANPITLQANTFSAIGNAVGTGIATYGSSGVGEPYIYTSYNASNVDILKTASNQVALTNISSINGNAFVPASPISFLVRPESNVSVALNNGDNYLASTFTGSASLAGNSVYRFTFKGVLTWARAPASNDWAQLYVQLGAGMPPDDTRLYPVVPILTDATGTQQQYLNLETLLRTSVSTTFDAVLSLNDTSSNAYTLNLNWITLQNVGSYT